MTSTGTSTTKAPPQQQARWIVPFLMCLLAITGSANAIAGKIRSEPLGEYSSFVTSMISQVVYFVVYWSILGVKWTTGNLAPEQMRWVWTPRSTTERSYNLGGFKLFWAKLPGFKFTFFASICDVMGEILMFMTQPYLSIIVFNLLQQGMVPFALMWSLIFLAVRYTAQEVLGVTLVMIMALISVATSSSTSDSDNGVAMSMICLGSTVFQALAFVLKECMFRDFTKFAEREGLEQTKLDVFAVSSSSNTFGVLWVFPLSVAVEMLRTDTPIMEHLGNGFETLFNAEGAMFALGVYLCINLCFNINIYMLVSYGSSVLTFVCLKITVPAAAFLSLASWPLIGSGTVTWFEWAALVVILAGIAIFRHGNYRRERMEAENRQDVKPKNVICLWPLFIRRKPADNSST